MPQPMSMILKKIWVLLLLTTVGLEAQEPTEEDHSMARIWIEATLEGIRNDFARPTVHARNLWHISAAMYDAWAVYDSLAQPYFLGNRVGGFSIDFDGIPEPAIGTKEAQKMAMSYAAYYIIRYRYLSSPGRRDIMDTINRIMSSNNYDLSITSNDYSNGNPAHLGNYIGEQVIQFGLSDGANEINFYQNRYYEPTNNPLLMDNAGNPNIIDINRWQPLTLEVFIDQAGNVVEGGSTTFLSPEWGNVVPFALTEEEKSVFERDGHQYNVYNDPGDPVYLQSDDPFSEESEAFKMGNVMVSIWGSHHDPADSVIWDISPRSIGNNPPLPETYKEFFEFYNFYEGGDASRGHDINPATNAPYEEQLVPRADYTRVLAEFWADGPDSETPPGHWYSILNSVHDHPLFERNYRGSGDALDDLEWDVKAYFLLGGAMHDAAISAWSIKGWYDYTRPVSAIRAMASLGQSSDNTLPNYHEMGLPLIPGFVEVVYVDDPLAGFNFQDALKIKIYTWRGPDFINDPENDEAGVGWILAENFWPYQRPTFVTPPFAGYVSGHSVYSAAAAEILTMLTGDEFFPGGMSSFEANKDEFLVFEDGPSQDLILQWATYKDAADQTSLSRIWGGIHPPIDDIPGRKIGAKVGKKAFNLGISYFGDFSVSTHQVGSKDLFLSLSPNPAAINQDISLTLSESVNDLTVQIFNILGQKIYEKKMDGFLNQNQKINIPTYFGRGTYVLLVRSKNALSSRKIQIH